MVQSGIFCEFDSVIVYLCPRLRNKVRRRGLLVASRKRTCLLEVKTCELQAGQSKAHLFEVGPYSSGGRVERRPESSVPTNGRDDNESPGVQKVPFRRRVQLLHACLICPEICALLAWVLRRISVESTHSFEIGKNAKKKKSYFEVLV